ncbi:MAG: class I SAM-dependent methyltransferase [Promethearchaeota archaeon]|nr:MAG: class I SAM-dependent methyltransferase [Candidatus Lokiarchaeota archaeon]
MISKIAIRIREILKRNLLLESIFYFIFRFLFFPISEKKIHFGFCTFCGKNSIFLMNTCYRRKDLEVIDPMAHRETGSCIFCTANTRRRFVAELIKKIIIIKLIHQHLDIETLKKSMDRLELKKFSLKRIVNMIDSRDFWIYESGSAGPIHNILKEYQKYIYSEYFPNPRLKPGQIYRNVRFEDLQSLSFKDNSLDLIITLDVFEHVERPINAFDEIYRVLRPNGVHVFTVPIGITKKTIPFFDDNGNPLHPLSYHDDPLRPGGALVHTQFGVDIVDILNRQNFPSFIATAQINPKFGIFSRVKVIISIKKVN